MSDDTRSPAVRAIDELLATEDPELSKGTHSNPYASAFAMLRIARDAVIAAEREAGESK